MPLITLNDVQNAQKRIKPSLITTPLVSALPLSRSLKSQIFLKLESLQLTGSFKSRGALNKLLSLSKDEKKKGIIACSAGNHAQGVAFHAHKMGIKATIVMPETTPIKKVENTKSWHADIVLSGESFSEAAICYQKLIAEKGYTPISAFDDPLIIAGQGTIGLEICQDHQDFDYILVPIGGGGLISGIATVVKVLSPKTKIIGVQSESCPSVINKIKKLSLPHYKATIAEGIAVKEPGKLTLSHIRKLVDDIFLVKEDTIEEAVYQLLTQEKLVVEGAGAAGLAALIENPLVFKGKKVGLIICGGNIDQSLLAHIITRGMMREGLFTLLRFYTEEKPGVLAKITTTLAEAGVSIVEVRHNRLFRNLPVKNAEIDITIETKGHYHLKEIKKHLKESNLLFEVLSPS